jgi:hypothetical protein
MLQIVASLTGNSISIINDRKMLIVQATGPEKKISTAVP